MELFQVVQCLFSNVWNLLVSVDFPGTGVSIAAILVGVFLIGLSIRIVVYIFGFSINATGSVSSGKHIWDPTPKGGKRK